MSMSLIYDCQGPSRRPREYGQYRHTGHVSPNFFPSWLSPWIGQLRFPHSLAKSILPPSVCGNGTKYSLDRREAQTIRYYPPAWFAHVEASIRFEVFPVHFCIQTPRIVSSLRFLGSISFDDFRMRVSSRDLTVFDVEPNGKSVLHVCLRFSQHAPF